MFVYLFKEEICQAGWLRTENTLNRYYVHDTNYDSNNNNNNNNNDNDIFSKE